MKKVGFMDSGVGGLTVLAHADQMYQDVEFLYFADMGNSPYGNKSSEKVNQLTLKAVDELVKQKVHAVVVACNTATSTSIEILRSCYTLPILGMEPAVKPAFRAVQEWHSFSKDASSAKIAVLATPLTLREQKFQSLVNSLSLTDSILPVECDGLSHMIDEENWEMAKTFLSQIVSEWKDKKVRAVVLGCTHYIFLKDYLQSLLRDIPVFDGNLGTVQRLGKILELEIRSAKRMVSNSTEFLTDKGKDTDFETKANRMIQKLKEENHES